MTGAIDKVVSPLTFESSQTDVNNNKDIESNNEEFSDVFEQANSTDDSVPNETQSDSAHPEDDFDHSDDSGQSESSEVIDPNAVEHEQTLRSEINIAGTNAQFSESILDGHGSIVPSATNTAPTPLSPLAAFDPTLSEISTPEIIGNVIRNRSLPSELKSPIANVQSNDVKQTLTSTELTATSTVLNNNLGLSMLSSSGDSIAADVSLSAFDNSQNVIKSTMNELLPAGGKSDALHGMSTAITTERPSLMSAANLVASLPIAHNSWGEQVGQKVLWMASQGLSEAEIQLDPPELGPLQAKVTINNEQAQVTFNSHSSQVREALEQTVARLRELFSSEGIDLVDVNVSDNPSQQQSQNSDVNDREIADRDEPLIEDYIPESTTINVASPNHYIVDDYI